jgi:type I restriction enzyme, S subunit
MKMDRIFDAEDHISRQGLANGTRLIEQGTVLIVVRGMILAKEFPVAVAMRELTFNQDLKALKCSPILDDRFLYYWLKSKTYEILGLADEAAHGTKRLQTDRLQNLEIDVPPRSTQRAIASVLSNYDDLIENNTRRIRILEDMAEMIYREWFVNFRFPGHEKVELEDSGLGPMPEGWCHSYPDHVDFLEGPGLRRWQYRESGLRFLNIRTIGNGDIDLSKAQFIDPAEAETKYRHFLLAEYDHVVSSSGTIGRIVTVRKEHLPLMLNTSVIRMRPRGDCVGRWQLRRFLKSEYFQAQIRAFASGVAQMNFGPSHLKQMKIVAPPVELGRRYEAMAGPIEELILNLTQKNSILRTNRDLLLPKLLSGEISVDHAESEAVAQGV